MMSVRTPEEFQKQEWVCISQSISNNCRISHEGKQRIEQISLGKPISQSTNQNGTKPTSNLPTSAYVLLSIKVCPLLHCICKSLLPSPSFLRRSLKLLCSLASLNLSLFVSLKGLRKSSCLHSEKRPVSCPSLSESPKLLTRKAFIK